MTRVKICGITNYKDAAFCCKCGVDFLGFIFYKKSARYIDPVNAAKIISRLPENVQKVGVFVNENINLVKDIYKNCGLDMLQFHGDEPKEYFEDFRSIKTIKAFRVGDNFSFSQVDFFEPDFFLFDSFKSGFFGGTGEVFDWGLFESFKELRRPFIISGGLNPGNIEVLLKRIAPFAVDVSSGVEKEPGIKDHVLVEAFIKIAKGVNIGKE